MLACVTSFQYLFYSKTDSVMDRFTLQLFITASMLGNVCHCWEAKVPQTVTGIKKSCVLVPCSTDTYSKVVWYKYQSRGYPTVYSSDQSEIIDEFKWRTSLPGSAEDGDCSLRIDNLQDQDSKVGLYVWVWKPDGDHKGFYEQTTKINLLEPQKPNLSVPIPQVEGKAFTAKCTFRTSCPTPPTLSWLGLHNISNLVSHTQSRDTLWDTEATATFEVTRQDQGKLLSCETTLSGQSSQTVSVKLDILYAPTGVKVEYTGGRTVVEGHTISLKCTSDSKPEPTEYGWFVTRNNTSTHHKGITVVLQDVMRDTSVLCIATNSVGKGESKRLLLDVYYAPTDVKVDYTGGRTVVEGHTISLKCTSDSKPEPTEYGWFVTQNNTSTHHKGSTVVLQDVMRDTSVLCIATNSVGKSESKHLLLDVYYPPSILPGAFCTTENGPLQCLCQADAKSKAVISWSIDGSNELFPHFNTRTWDTGSVTMSELTGPLGWEGKVNCTASNIAGTEYKQMHVHSKRIGPLIGAGAAGVCFILGLVAAIVICKKRRRAEQPINLGGSLPLTSNKTINNYDSDEDLYVNVEQAEQAAESCIYQNYDNPS